MGQTPGDPTEDASTRQARIFLREFESLVEKLIGEIQSPALAEQIKRQRNHELREVYSQIRRLRAIYPGLRSRLGQASGQSGGAESDGGSLQS